MLAYNHGPYLRGALNSILNQKTDFGFEILAHDDASQDDSGDILCEYAARYPAIVKPIIQTTNQFSQGIYPSVHFNYPRAHLPFVAFCEGDDHWTNENKLQVQIDALTAHPEINLSFHQAIRVNCLDTKEPDLLIGDYGPKNAIVPFNDVLFRIRGMIPTASCIIRQSTKQRFLDFISTRPYLTLGDLYFQLFGSDPKGALYISKPMSIYRYGTTHSWTCDILSNWPRKVRHEKAMLRSYLELNHLTSRRYHDKFLTLTLQRLIWLFNPNKSEKPLANPLLSDTQLPPEVISAANLDILFKPYQQCQHAIKAQLADWKSKATQYVIFGCASGCELTLSALGTERIAAIIDRDCRRVGERLHGIQIIAPTQLAEFPEADLIVSTMSFERASITTLAQAAGLPPSRVHFLFDPAICWLDKHPFEENSLT